MQGTARVRARDARTLALAVKSHCVYLLLAFVVGNLKFSMFGRKICNYNSFAIFGVKMHTLHKLLATACNLALKAKPIA